MKPSSPRHNTITPNPHSDALDSGKAALAGGDWLAARNAFTAAVAAQETAEALEGLGLASWWLDSADDVFDARERAYKLYRERNDFVSAARIAVWLAWDTAAFRGEQAVANGWLQRARRLLQDSTPVAEQAWLSLRESAFALLEHGDPDEALRHATDAVRIAHAVGAVDFAMVGQALQGFALVTAGRVTDGMRQLDEVNAAVVAGELTDRVSIGLACCYLIAACDRVRDYQRAAEWCDRLKAFCTRWGFRPLFAVCRTQYASLCMWRGAWDEAERELSSAVDELAASRPAMTAEGLARLGELRRRQGRLADADALFERCASHPVALLGRVAVTFDRGDFRTAVELAERHLRNVPMQNRTDRAAALELLIRALLQLGKEDEARKALEELIMIATEAATAPLRGSASLTAGLVAAAAGDGDAARRHLEDAVDLFDRSGAPFEVGRARIELARVLDSLGRTEAAQEEARRAVELLASMNADLELARARGLLARLSVMDASKPAGGAPAGGLTRREIEILRLISRGMSNQAIADQLFISEHTVHRHVANTLTKLNVSARSAAVAHAARLGLL